MAKVNQEDQRLLAAALRRLEKESLSNSFDPMIPNSRPTERQWEIYRDIETIQQRFILAGNQCLAKGTLVATSLGPKPIEEMQVGDIVYDPFGRPIKVLKTFANGPKAVRRLMSKGMEMARCTDDHVWVTHPKNGRLKPGKAPQCKPVNKFAPRTCVMRTRLQAPLGPVNEPHTYALAVFLGDGCSTANSRTTLHISTGDKEVIDHVAELLQATKVANNDFTWRIHATAPKWYDEWCRDRKAHQKLCNLDTVKTWNRESLLRFVAGIMDSDGSVFLRKVENRPVVALEMQAKEVVEAFAYACLALWQIPINVRVYHRAKYVNGPTYLANCTRYGDVHCMLKELSPFLKTERRKWRPEYEKLDRISKWPQITPELTTCGVEETFDIHVNSKDNLYCLANGLVTHNSGKSSAVAREVAWILNGDHPFWERPSRWGTEPLLILVAGQDRKQMEVELWEKKLSPFLDKSEWKPQRQAGVLQYVVNRRTEDRILFLSHSDSSETNRKHMQGYVAHYVWLDEMPGSHIILEELQRRVDARRGYLVASFTPKFRNEQLRRIIDAGTPPLMKKYTMSKLDNPVFLASREDEIKKLDGYSEAYKRAILYGEWYAGDSAVYEWVPLEMLEAPDGYSTAWRHVEVVDPALKSKFGYTLWAENPATGVWYLVRDEYFENIFNPETMVNEVIKASYGYNIVRRISDQAPWFTGIASSKGLHYVIPYHKNANRKDELIKNFQHALSSGKVKIAPHCTRFQEEIQSCQWSETGERIINSSSFHIMDCAQYFVDGKPAYDPTQLALPWHQELRLANHKRKKEQASKIQKGGRVKPLRAWRLRGRGTDFTRRMP